MSKDELLNELLSAQRQYLAARNIPYNDKSLNYFRSVFSKCDDKRIRQEITARLQPPPTEAEKNETQERRKKRIQEECRQRDADEGARNNLPEPPPFSLDNYEGVKHVVVGQELNGELVEEVVAVRSNGDIILKIGDPGFCSKHMKAGKEYTFKLHKSWRGSYNLWSLKAEQHECYDDYRGSYGADVLVCFDEDEFLFDLDS